MNDSISDFVVNNIGYIDGEFRMISKKEVLLAEAVPLTDEWLTLLGFDKIVTGSDYFYSFALEDKSILMETESSHCCHFNYRVTTWSGHEIENVHEVQNFYYHQTRSELHVDVKKEHMNIPEAAITNISNMVYVFDKFEMTYFNFNKSVTVAAMGIQGFPARVGDNIWNEATVKAVPHYKERIKRLQSHENFTEESYINYQGNEVLVQLVATSISHRLSRISLTLKVEEPVADPESEVWLD